MDRGTTRQATVHGAAKSQTLSSHTNTHTHIDTDRHTDDVHLWAYTHTHTPHILWHLLRKFNLRTHTHTTYLLRKFNLLLSNYVTEQVEHNPNFKFASVQLQETLGRENTTQLQRNSQNTHTTNFYHAAKFTACVTSHTHPNLVLHF